MYILKTWCDCVYCAPKKRVCVDNEADLTLPSSSVDVVFISLPLSPTIPSDHNSLCPDKPRERETERRKKKKRWRKREQPTDHRTLVASVMVQRERFDFTKALYSGQFTSTSKYTYVFLHTMKTCAICNVNLLFALNLYICSCKAVHVPTMGQIKDFLFWNLQKVLIPNPRIYLYISCSLKVGVLMWYFGVVFDHFYQFLTGWKRLNVVPNLCTKNSLQNSWEIIKHGKCWRPHLKTRWYQSGDKDVGYLSALTTLRPISVYLCSRAVKISRSLQSPRLWLESRG